MPNVIRQIIFLTTAFILRWPLFMLIGLIGRTGIFKTVFLVYATDEVELLGVYPDIPFIRRFLSGKPTPAGLIMNGWRPMGIYFGIPDLPRDLARKKNRHIAEKIVQQMHWFRRLAGAKTIGLAGQLGPIFAHRHNIPMDPPIFTSTYGNVFSIHEAINWVAKQKGSFLHRQKIAVIGGGELGITLQDHLENKGYDCSIINVRYTLRGKVVPSNTEKNNEQLQGVDFVVNLMPRGEDFMTSGLGNLTPPNAAIIDFSRPSIPKNTLKQKIYLGNRIQCPGLRFMLPLPGTWTQKQIPACSLPAIIAATTGKATKHLDSFCMLARQNSFGTALANTPAVTLYEKLSFQERLEGILNLGKGKESAPDGVELLSQK